MSKRKKPQSRSPRPPRPGAKHQLDLLVDATHANVTELALTGEPLEVLQRLRMQRELTAQSTDVAMLLARRRGIPWSDIGAALGVSAQAAEQRFSRLGSTFVERFLVEKAA
uniref:Uncharacterized protein n=1 Tax=uncultured prokaryote TaxID=198431 RepID=A0A0H5Q592_9ZZZZ|nr:hypothetical protein [uncultured prokaryote]